MSAIEKDVDIKDSKISKLEYEKESIQIEMGKQVRCVCIVEGDLWLPFE